MSIGLTILCVGLAFRFFVRGSGMEVMIGVGMLAITFGCALFTIRGYTITRNALLVHRLLWNTRLSLDGLKSARFELGAMRWGIRCGNGGFFSFTGLFYNRKLGFHRAFVTDHIRTVVLRYPHRIVVVSPADPEAFVRDLAIPIKAMTRDEQTRVNEAEWQKPGNWTGSKWLSVYFSKRDSRAWVPKQIPALGSTVNLGNPHGAFALLAIVSAIIIALIVVPLMIFKPAAGPIKSNSSHRLNTGLMVETNSYGGNGEAVPGTGQLSFGPVVERVVPCEMQMRSISGINLESGRIETFSFGTNDVPPGGLTGEKYFEGKGVDMIAMGDPKLMPQSSGLYCRLGTFAMPVEESDWDSTTAAVVLTHATNLPSMSEPIKNTPEFSKMTVMLLSEDGVFPKTFIFHTRTGSAGFLQLTGFTDNPRGVKIRYKLVQQNAKAEAMQVNDEVARLKLQIANSELEIARRKFKTEVLSQAANDLSASNIVVLMQQAYATIYTYRDSGWTVFQYGDDVWTNKFSELVDRRKLYRIEIVTAQHPFSQTNRWWSDGDMESWQQGSSIILRNSSPASEASNLSLVNQDSTVPALFYNLNWGNILKTLSYGSATELVRQKDEVVSGVDCYVLERTNIGLKVWVGKQDFLIRRHRNFISKAAAAEAMKHSPNTNPLPAQADITNTQTHENVNVNEHLSKDDFLPTKQYH